MLHFVKFHFFDLLLYVSKNHHLLDHIVDKVRFASLIFHFFPMYGACLSLGLGILGLLPLLRAFNVLQTL